VNNKEGFSRHMPLADVSIKTGGNAIRITRIALARIRSGRYAILIYALVLVAIASALSCKQTGAPAATVKMQSTSPNGKYRCVVKEQLPSEGYASPYIYTFTIRDAVMNRDLKGESYQRNTDSVALSDLKFAWLENELTVSLPTTPPRRFLTAKIHDEQQQWTSVGN
jgi:hypothetical protein